jgi:ssDNA-binding Zn-finger/Zn-ribbon topoisomerase 1
MLAAVTFVCLTCPVCDYEWQEATAGDILPATLAKITTCPRCDAPPPMIVRVVDERGPRG